MGSNDTNKNKVSQKVLYPELSFEIVECLFAAHNHLGRFAKEKQYGDYLEHLFLEKEIPFEREKSILVDGIKNSFTNKLDFDINKSVILEIKAKPIISRDDYEQIKRYLFASKRSLGIIANFRNKYLKPIRIIRLNS